MKRRDFVSTMAAGAGQTARQTSSALTAGAAGSVPVSATNPESLTEPHSRTTGPAGELMIAIAACIAKQERIRISDRTKAGLATARNEGKFANCYLKADFPASRSGHAGGACRLRRFRNTYSTGWWHSRQREKGA
jgi:hypothetical protein